MNFQQLSAYIFYLLMIVATILATYFLKLPQAILIGALGFVFGKGASLLPQPPINNVPLSERR